MTFLLFSCINCDLLQCCALLRAWNRAPNKLLLHCSEITREKYIIPFISQLRFQSLEDVVYLGNEIETVFLVHLWHGDFSCINSLFQGLSTFFLLELWQFLKTSLFSYYWKNAAHSTSQVWDSPSNTIHFSISTSFKVFKACVLPFLSMHLQAFPSTW